ncbi:hypothetical protein EYF80_020388 [Liparis tanakae]|uniref:Uncharacterized protein n=1 Tax=Liparis tanakae TaxID=230148 RepID=A0A4Z2HUM7_9TELE|nr:hypothetical protein EYF80_020388 [Liparis tanakae]
MASFPVTARSRGQSTPPRLKSSTPTREGKHSSSPVSTKNLLTGHPVLIPPGDRTACAPGKWSQGTWELSNSWTVKSHHKGLEQRIPSEPPCTRCSNNGKGSTTISSKKRPEGKERLKTSCGSASRRKRRKEREAAHLPFLTGVKRRRLLSMKK